MSIQSVGSVLVVLVVAFTAYLSAVMLRRINAVVLRDSYMELFRYELVVCACFLLFALDVRFGFFTGLRAIGWTLRALVVLGVAVFLFFAGRITAGAFVRAEDSAQKAVVLGMALEKGRPTGDLVLRLDAAEAYLRENPQAVLILTGGNPDESGRTEAAVMRDLLAARGVAADRMVLEDRAEDTRENFRNTARLVDPGEPIVLISSNYHMDRAVRTAKRAGFAAVLRRPAPSSALYFGANVMWEVILELNEMTLKKQARP